MPGDCTRILPPAYQEVVGGGRLSGPFPATPGLLESEVEAPREGASNKFLAPPSGDSAHYSLVSLGVRQGTLGPLVQCPAENWASWNPE